MKQKETKETKNAIQGNFRQLSHFQYMKAHPMTCLFNFVSFVSFC